MAEFNKENKISYDELTPSLQALLDNSVTKDEFNEVLNQIKEVVNQLSGIRLSIVKNTNEIPNPQNDKELAIVLGDEYTFCCTYNNGWKKSCAVYA